MSPPEPTSITAVGEVKEETGLDARIIMLLAEVVYYYRRGRGPDSVLVHKTVYHYLMQALTHDFGPPNWEVSECRWVPLNDAQTVLSYQNDLEVVSKAQELLGVRGQESANRGEEIPFISS